MSLVALAALLAGPTADAQEGLLRPHQLVDLEAELRSDGLEVPVAALADLEAGPLSSVAQLEGCSGAFVGEDGLLVTAFHCITDALLFASQRGEDLVSDGFYAPERGLERWGGPSARIRVTLSVEDVTEAVRANTRRLEGRARFDRMEANIKDLVRRCETGPDIECRVAAYGQGVEYQLIRQRQFKDVRLVLSPPRSIGYYGGEADNWQWPRHSGDFAFLRVYDGPVHNPQNDPYTPPSPMRLNPDGVTDGDFVWVAGYPGSTFRWRSAAELEFASENAYPRHIRTAREIREVLQRHADREPQVAAQVAPRMINLGNNIQYLEGNLQAFQRVGLVESKWAFEQELARWIAADPDRASRYDGVLDNIAQLQAEQAASAERDHIAQQLLANSAMLHAAYTLYRLADESRRPDRQREAGWQNRDRPAISARMDQRFVGYDWRIDRELLRHFMLQALRLPKGVRIAELDAWLAAQPSQGTLEQRLDAALDRLYANQTLSDDFRRRSLMETSPWFLTRSDDAWFGLAEALLPYYRRFSDQQALREAAWSEVRPRYTAAVEAFIPEARPRYIPTIQASAPGLFYHDGNSTLRVGVGRVQGYTPRDGLLALPFTRLEGIREKAGAAPFDAPAPLLAAIERDDQGPYVHPPVGSVPVNFVTTLDTARGSSGSPTLDAQGRWIGLIFDGNSEAMASDWLFDETVTRSIHTDVRYVLWYLDAVAGADALLTELGVGPSLAAVPPDAQPRDPVLWE